MFYAAYRSSILRFCHTDPHAVFSLETVALVHTVETKLAGQLASFNALALLVGSSGQ